MCWNAYLLRRATRGYVESVCLTNGPFSNYYAQESIDDGIIMESDVPVKDVINSDFIDLVRYFFESERPMQVFPLSFKVKLNIKLLNQVIKRRRRHCGPISKQPNKTY